MRTARPALTPRGRRVGGAPGGGAGALPDGSGRPRGRGGGARVPRPSFRLATMDGERLAPADEALFAPAGARRRRRPGGHRRGHPPAAGQRLEARAARRHRARHPARRRLRAAALPDGADRGGDRRIRRDRQVVLRGAGSPASSTPPSTRIAADDRLADDPSDEFAWIASPARR